MTELLLTNIRKQARSAESHFTAVEGSVAASYFGTETDALKEADARVVEGQTLRAIDVATAEASAFTAFLDGIQRAEVKLYYQSVPIVYAFASAVVRARSDRRMHTLRHDGAELLVEREALFFPSEYVGREEMRALVSSDEQLIDTTPRGAEPVPLFPPLLHARAAQFINRWREALERGLAGRWCAAPQGWLLIDGSLTVSPEVSACGQAAGIIKSHRTRFFDGDDARVVLGLKPGQRTSVFEPATRSVTPVRSWYLRLRPADRRDVFWGLVRVEVAVTHDVAIADRVSSWLLAETTPLSLPDARWDRLLYPIHDCEEFLRARAPML
jgi:hypothetical protein